MEWTEERVASLTELWNTGLSAAQIAERLGGVTRNAVIGKVHRLKLSGRPSPIKRHQPPPPRPRPRPRVVPSSDQPCQWPFGDPGEADFHFCGVEAMPGRPYCPEHVAMAYHRVDDKAQSGKANKAA